MIKFTNGSVIGVNWSLDEPIRGIGEIHFWDDERGCFVTIDHNEKVTYWGIEEEDK